MCSEIIDSTLSTTRNRQGFVLVHSTWHSPVNLMPYGGGMLTLKPQTTNQPGYVYRVTLAGWPGASERDVTHVYYQIITHMRKVAAALAHTRPYPGLGT